MEQVEKDRLVKEVMQGFDFEMAHAVAMMTKKYRPTMKEFKEQAEKNLRLALEHQDREFWWAGGMHHGGICACYDDKLGLSLNYIVCANKVHIPKMK